MRACLGGRAFVIHVAGACMLPVLRVRWIKREEGLDSVLYFYFLAGICERFQTKYIVSVGLERMYFV
jgi:hypothetical protein